MRIDRPARRLIHPQANGKINQRHLLTSLTLNPQIAHLPVPIGAAAAAAAATGLTGWCRRALGSPRAAATGPPHGFLRGTVNAYPTKQIPFAHDRCSQVLLRVYLRVMLCVAVGCVELGNFSLDERSGLGSGDLGGDFALGSLVS